MAETINPLLGRGQKIGSNTEVPILLRGGGGGTRGPSVPIDYYEGLKDPQLFTYKGMEKVPDVPQKALTRNVSKKADISALNELLARPEVRQGVTEAIQRGMKEGGREWYNTEELKGDFVKELGPEHGPAAYRKFLDFVAATSSPRSDPGTNVRNASYYYSKFMQGEPMPAPGTKNPQPYGHMAQILHQKNVAKVAGPGWDPLKNPKPASFVENLMGNQEPGTMDTHAYRLPAVIGRDPRFLATSFKASKGDKPRNLQAELASGKITMDEAVAHPAWWESMPGKFEYGPLERFYSDIGKEQGITPAQSQASAWLGGGKMTGRAGADSNQPFMKFVEERVNLTAKKRGLSPQDVLRDFITGKSPLLSIGGAAFTFSQLPTELQSHLIGSTPPPPPDNNQPPPDYYSALKGPAT